MSTDEKLALLEDCMDIEKGTLRLDDLLSNLEEWDSLTILTIISAFEEKTGKTIASKALRKASSVADVLGLID